MLAVVQELNADPRIDGILVQLPVPKQIDSKAVIDAIAVEKDVDGFNPREPRPAGAAHAAPASVHALWRA